ALEAAIAKILGGDGPEQWDRLALHAHLSMHFMLVVDEVLDARATPSREILVAAAQAEGEAAFSRKIEYLKDFGKKLGLADVDVQILSQVL
ncbi:MAG: hypothetical protein AAB075_04825, partial [Gemmatimonadota bacterium]